LIVKQITIYPEKGGKGESAAKVQLVAGEGILGDYHKNVSLMTTASHEFVRQNPSGMCMARFKAANFLVEGDLADSEFLKITGGKRFCFPECPIFSDDCPFKAGVGFADVIKDGVITIEE